MIYAILAAGNGERLQQEGLLQPKPLVKVGGEAILDRLVRISASNGADEIWVISNAGMTSVKEHLQALQASMKTLRDTELHFIEAQTPSSSHSLEVLSKHMPAQPFILTTVDTIFREAEFAEYVAAFQRHLDEGSDALMGITRYVDDEKPLYVSIDGNATVTGFHDSQPTPPTPYVSAGIYGLTPQAVQTLYRCLAQGNSRMRNYQRALLDEGLKVKAYTFGDVIDIDHISDIQHAEKLIRQ